MHTSSGMILLTLCSLLLNPLSGQAPRIPPASVVPSPPRVTLLGGLGNALGWLGVQGEAYFATGRLSAYAGLGYTPDVEPGDPSGLTGAAGLRGYTGGRRHRAFVELGISQVAVEVDRAFQQNGAVREEGRRLYGPGLQIGYQYMAHRGFTAMVSTGVGYILAEPPLFASRWQPLLGLGFGYTWR